MFNKRILAMVLVVAMTLVAFAGCSKPAEKEEPTTPATTEEKEAEAPAEDVDPVTIKISTVLTESSPGYRSLAAFKDEVNATSEGKIEVMLFGNGQLGGAADGVEQIRTNDIQMLTLNPMGLNTTVPVLATLDNYFMFDDMDHAYRFFDGEGGQIIMDSFQSQGMQGLGILPIGFRQLTNNKRPVTTVADMNGLKLRGYNPVQIAAWESVGCNLSAVAWGELFTSLQQNLIDGQEGALTSFAEQRFYEVQDYVTITNHVFSTDVLVVGLEFYQGLSEENKAIIDAALANMFAENHATVVEETNALMSSLTTDHGTQFSEVSPEVKAELREKMSAVTEAAIIEICGQETFDQIKALVDAAK